MTANILAMLEQNEQVHEEPLRVRFPESLAIAEGLNLQIMEIVDAAGTKFALPGKSIYMEDGSD